MKIIASFLIGLFAMTSSIVSAATTTSTGSVPLGDYKYVTTAAKKGYVYLCNVRKDNPGSMTNGPWMHGTTWNYLEKISISGKVSWPTATFTNTVSSSGTTRTLAGNGLPKGHTTGVFPVASTDAAHAYDANPNTISAQTLRNVLPTNPTYSETPYCMGGEVGVMLTGVPLFNAFDAGLRDAAAHELQDACSGHPQGSGEYHYHSLSACFKDISATTVLGYALDGYPITGPKVSDKKSLVTDDLDICHGLKGEIIVDGKKKTTYHYVMTQDFPYSASCFRGKPVQMQVISGRQIQTKNQPVQDQSKTSAPSQQSGAPSGQRTPPQEAIAVCANKSADASCSFTAPMGSVSGVCKTVPEGVMACVPTNERGR